MGAVQVKKSKKEQCSDHDGKVKCLRCGRGFDPSAEGATSEYGATCAKKMGISVPTRTSPGLTLVTSNPGKKAPTQMDFFTDVDPNKIKEMETDAYRNEATANLKEATGVEVNPEEAVEIDIEKRDSGTENEYYETDSNFTWARKSKFQNFGEETRGAARHKRNTHREWGDVVNNAHEAALDENVLYPEVIKNVQRGMAGVVDETNEMESLILGLILNKFPKKLPEMKDVGDYHKQAKLLISDILALKLQSTNPLDYFNRAKDMLKSAHSKAEHGLYRNLCRHLQNSLDYKSTSAKREFLKMIDFVNGENTNWYYLKPEEVAERLNRVKGKLKDYSVRYLKGEGIKKLTGRTTPRENSGPKKATFKHSDFYKGMIPEVKKIRFKGYDDSYAFFTKKMKVKGFEFGNGISDSKRPDYIRTAAQSFEDLSAITGLSPEQLTGRGTLGVLIGVKGVAGSLATYWPSTTDININANSVGSIAHEMGHFFDHHLGKKFKKKFLSETGLKSDSYGSEAERVYADLGLAMEVYGKRIKATKSFGLLSNKSQKTFVSPEETFARCFEAFVNKRAKDKGIKNNVLVANVESELYPTDEELADISGKMEILLDVMKKTI